MLTNTLHGVIYAPAGLASGAQVGVPDVRQFMERTGCNEAQARAVIAVESAGRGFTMHKGKRVPKILLESHKVYQNSGALPLSRHAPHLSSRYWNRKNYNRLGRRREPGEDLQHARLDELFQLGDRLEQKGYPNAGKICRRAGIESCSWGLGQVLGSHWESLGYASLQEFLDAQYRSEGAQIDTMARYIVSNGLADELRAGGRSARSWRGLANGYNGPAYAAHNYHGRLARAYVRAGGR